MYCSKIITDKKEWSESLKNFKEKDIYFEYEYLDLYRTDTDTPILFFMTSSLGKAIYPFMLRDISYEEKLNGKIEKNKYFDITTAYGYGGPIVEPLNEKDRENLLKEFYSKLNDYYREKNIVTEFIRFSPLLLNHKDMDTVIDSSFLRKTVATDLQSYGDPIYGEVKKRKRNSAKKCRKLGMKTVFEFAPKNFDRQLKIYYDTMERNDATDFYYFSKDYFEKMFKTLSENLLLVNVMLDEKLIGFELCFLYEKFIHTHLAGTLSEHLRDSPNDLSIVDVISWGHENGYKYLFAGGGTTNEEDDSLLFYKRSFSKNTEFDFHVGQKIWNPVVYDKLCSLAHGSELPDHDFFPLYRSSR